MKRTDHRERMAGLFVLAAVLCVVAFAAGSAIENGWFAARQSFYTIVTQGDGLREGSPVLVSGLEVGEVGTMRLLPDSRIKVEVRVLQEHASRVREGTLAEVRRVLGVGQKRVHLITTEQDQPPLKPGSGIAAREPLDLLEAVDSIDLDRHAALLAKVVTVSERILGSVEDSDRFERMAVAFDQLPETLGRANRLLETAGDPLVELLEDRNLRRTLKGAAIVFNDPATMQFVGRAADAIEPEKFRAVVARMDGTLARMDKLLAEDSHLHGALSGADRLLQDKRIYKLIGTMDRLSDAEKLERLLDNVAVLAHQTAKVGPEIPKITRELMLTLREAVVVLRAMQKSWILEDEAAETRREMKRGK